MSPRSAPPSRAPRGRRPAKGRTAPRRFVCVHGHFYQPPREHPWTETVAWQPSASPYHDWNERITAECYGANASSRILGERDELAYVVNNYERMSFNFGPTLLSWMEVNEPAVYRAILEADVASRRRFGGHGSAMAQAHGHLIMPLANERDQHTQVRWGLCDFEHRFGRSAEGMWLPETAVDLATLEVLAAHGVSFTLLAPRQARAVRPPGGLMQPVAEVDTARPYRVPLPSGRSIAVFFYDGPTSQAIAFEGLLKSGADLAQRLLGVLDGTEAGERSGDTPAALSHIATDGETYGHHHRFGDMALAFALRAIEERPDAALTNYGQFLAEHPPTWEAEIHERTSWSCAHGVERWRSDCGCRMSSGTSQAWRGPLRDALDWLRDRLARGFEERGSLVLRDPWAARDAYIDVLLYPERRPAFLAEHAGRTLAPSEQTAAWQWLECQRHAMSMYTSCGWFFDALSRIETLQVLAYAARAAELFEALTGEELDTELASRLAQAPDPKHQSGERVYSELVRPLRVSSARLGARSAVLATVGAHDDRKGTSVRFVVHSMRTLVQGDRRLEVGTATVERRSTSEQTELVFAVAWLGELDVVAGACELQRVQDVMWDELERAFASSSAALVVDTMRRHFEERVEGLDDLSRDEHRAVVARLLELARAPGAATTSAYALCRRARELGVPGAAVVEARELLTATRHLAADLDERDADAEAVRRWLFRVREGELATSRAITHHVAQAVVAACAAWREAPADLARLERLLSFLAIGGDHRDQPWLRVAQDDVVRVREGVAQEQLRRAEAGDVEAGRWVDAFRQLAREVRVSVAR